MDRKSSSKGFLWMAAIGALAGGFLFLVLYTTMPPPSAFRWAGGVAFGTTYLVHWFAESEANDISLREYILAGVAMSLGSLVFSIIGALIWRS